jgi:hypothetical protein
VLKTLVAARPPNGAFSFKMDVSTMRRLHLFEFSDQWWFPEALRHGVTAYLATVYRLSRPLPQRWAEKISTVLLQDERSEILDLCSGSGGPITLIIQELVKRGYNVQATLTDLYPHPKSASNPRITWWAEPVDATHVPSSLTGVRTMFSAFHHFRPDAAIAILKDAFESRRAICIFESGSGGWLNFGMALGHPIILLALMPFVRPFRWSYLVFTYLIPLIPLSLLWDVIVSFLRVYSLDQMAAMTEVLKAPDYSWEIGRIQVRGIPGGLPYLIGRPIILGNAPAQSRRTQSS